MLLLGLFCVIGFLGAGCAKQLTLPTEESAWKDVGRGVSRFEERLVHDGVAAKIVLFRLPKEGLEWRFVTTTLSQARPFSSWQETMSDVMLLMNAGYFHPDGQPSGDLYIHDSRESARQFDLDRSLWVSFSHEGVHLGLTRRKSADVAFQTYPWLIKNGREAFTEETGQYARRTFLGVDTEGRSYLGFVPVEGVTLRQLTQLMQETPVRWESVANLDGGPSTGYAWITPEWNERVEPFAPLPFFLVLRAASSTR